MPGERPLNPPVHTSLITLTSPRGWCDFQLICNYQAPRGGWLNNRLGHRSRRDTVAGHMGSGPEGSERVDAGVGTGGKLAEWSERKIELFGRIGDRLIKRQPHRADVFTPVSISHFTPGLLPDRMCAATSFYPQIHNHPPPVKGGYSALSITTLPPAAPFASRLPDPHPHPRYPFLPPHLSCCWQAPRQHGVITDKQSILH